MRSIADPTVERFLRKSLIARIATLSPAGNADIIPLYFVVHAGHIWMGTRGGNPTVRDLKQHPEVVLQFHGEQFSASGHVLRLRGQAAFRTGRRRYALVYARFALKYWLSAGGWNMLRNWRKVALDRRYKAERSSEGGLIEVVPETVEFLKLPR
jgi:uncharacterized pyridoxamine 5'-phosphate oxidase family protein